MTYDYPTEKARVRVSTHGARKAGPYRAWKMPSDAASLLRQHGFQSLGSYAAHELMLPMEWNGFVFAKSKEAPPPPEHIELEVDVLTDEGLRALDRDCNVVRTVSPRAGYHGMGWPGYFRGTEDGQVVYTIRGTDYRRVLPSSFFDTNAA